MIRRVTSTADAEEFLRWLGERRPLLALDTETSGLQFWRQGLRTVQMGDSRSAWVLSYRDWRGVIAEALARYDRPVVFHNAPFDLHFLERAGLTLPPLHRTHDTFIMDSLVNTGLRHGLKPIAVRLFGAGDEEQDELAAAFKVYGWDWATVPEDFEPYWRYAGQDTVLTARVAEALWPQVQPYRTAYDLEMAVQAIAYRMERRGMAVDLDYVAMLRDSWAHDMERLPLLVPEFDVRNAAALQRVCLADGWVPDAWTPGGKPQFDKDVVESINSPFTRIRTRYKRLEKWTAAYLDHFTNEHDNGRIHANIRTMQALTGRMSITKPALQTLPRGPEIRDAFVADEDSSLWMVDYAGLQMRLLAHDSEEPGLCDALRNGENLHAFVAKQVYKDDTITSLDPRYTLAKNTQFGFVFGSGTERTAKTAGVPLAEAEAFQEEYNRLFPGVRKFLDSIVQAGRARERSEGVPYITTIGGRRIPSLDGRTYALCNYRIQGNEADIIKRKAVDLDAAGYGEWMRLIVHDEVIFNVPNGMEDEMPKVREIMEDDTLRVPLTCDVSGPYQRWGDKYR